MTDLDSRPGLELSEPESLVVRAWRTIILGRCRLPRQSFGSPDGLELIEAIATFLRALNHGSRHVLDVGHPGCPTITFDERQLLTVIAAAQADDAPLLTSHLTWLVRSDRREDVAQAVHALGRILRAQGMCLPLPAPRAFAARAMLAIVREESRAS
jgi:hypothetical protein